MVENNDLNNDAREGEVVIVAMMIIFLFAIFAGFNAIYSLDENQDAVLTTFGQPSIEENSGLHFKIPFIQKLEKVDMSVQGMSIGYDEMGTSIENESLMITKDFNFVSVDFYVEWQVTDAIAYLYASEKPTLILKTLTMSYIRDTVGSYSVDEVLTTSKGQIQSEIKDKLVSRLEAEGIGLTVRSVAIQDAEPPTQEVSNAFKAVEDAKQRAEETVNGAKAYQNQKIPSAEAQVKSIIETATAEKASRIAEAQGQIARFNSMYEEYVKFPEVTKERMYFEAMEEILPGVRVILQDGNGTTVNVLGNGGN